jgi:uncharacterized membrane protein
MSETTSPISAAPTPSTASTYTIVMVIYVLYFVGFFTGVTALIGVVMAHIKSSDADPDTLTHFRYQKRTFWYGLLMVVIGSALAYILIGVPILLWWFVWTLIRCVKGFLAAQTLKPLSNPTTLLW